MNFGSKWGIFLELKGLLGHGCLWKPKSATSFQRHIFNGFSGPGLQDLLMWDPSLADFRQLRALSDPFVVKNLVRNGSFLRK